jgi:cytochrome c
LYLYKSRRLRRLFIFYSTEIAMRNLSLCFVLASFAVSPAIANQDLAAKNGCMACHSVDKTVFGPAFKDVARKYKGDKDALAKLAAKVKGGGSGVWGDRTMPPQQAPEADVTTIVSWVMAMPSSSAAKKKPVGKKAPAAPAR